ncbi:MAG: YbaK/EbsC family protein, partial [Ligilactobacillus ruminis]|nr:YbaK/EbsC family protein [Ligilactobacillus ruminis]
MSREKVEQYLEKENYADRIIVLEDSSATVEEAAHALGCEPEH